MFVILWMFHVKPDREREFVQAYAPDGEWAALFRRDAHYLGTELLRDEATPLRYVTIDRWTSASPYASFLARNAGDFEALDRRCDELTEQEMKVGEYASVPNDV